VEPPPDPELVEAVVVVVVVVVVAGVDDVLDELLAVLVLEVEVDDPLPLAQGFHTVTVQPPLDEPPLDVEVLVVPLLVLDVDVDEDADDVEALAGTIQSGPVLPFARHEALSLIIRRYSAALAMFSANRHRQNASNARIVEWVNLILRFILKPPCKMSAESVTHCYPDTPLTHHIRAYSVIFVKKKGP